ncbi:hypothetical protein GCM10022206_19530 [Streptomyces chiangmaiensis]
MFTGVRGRQMGGRCVLVRTGPFPRNAEWRSLIATLEDTLRLHRHQPKTLVNLSDYLHQRTGGMIGSLSHLIRGRGHLRDPRPERTHHPGPAEEDPDRPQQRVRLQARDLCPEGRMSQPTRYWLIKPLPRPVTPFPQETEQSYLKRLGDRN